MPPNMHSLGIRQISRDRDTAITVHTHILPYTVKSPGRTSRLAYIRRHISTSGNAQFDAKLAQLESMEKCFHYADNQVRKTNHFSTETLISGHNCSKCMRATQYFHFRFGAKCRQTCTAYAYGQTSRDRDTAITVHTHIFALYRQISGQNKSSGPHPTPYFYFR